MTVPAELKYRVLLEISQRISRTLDLPVVLDDLVRALRSAIACDAAGIFVLSRAVPLLRRSDANVIAGMVQTGFDAPAADDPMLRSGKGIIGHVVHTGEVVSAPDVRLDPRYVAGRRETRSELAVPIVGEAGVIGCFNVESDRLAAFTPADAELLEFFASAAAVSIEKALLHRQVLEKQRIEDQLEVAREVQAGLLPGGPPDVPGYDIAAIALPTGAIGGDYYDYVPLEGGRLGVVVADVSGKGIPAALIMATFRAALRTEMRRHAEVPAVAAELNRVVMESRDASRFVTTVCGVLEQGSGLFTYVNCGHNPPLLLRASGEAETLQEGGPALGIIADQRFESGAVCVGPGDCLVLFTDGVVEPADGGDVEFGVERLAAAVRGAGQGRAEDALRSVIDATHGFSGRDEYEDDFTLVVLKRHATAGGHRL
ncbi:MAG TPA: GAF domain-containing SpoIIE family protein phosphatase [Vicinamibacteria bacterium]